MSDRYDQYMCDYQIKGKKGQPPKRCGKRNFYTGFTIPFSIGINDTKLCTQHYKVLSKINDARQHSITFSFPLDCFYYILEMLDYKSQYELMSTSFWLNGVIKQWCYNNKPIGLRHNPDKYQYKKLIDKQIDDFIIKNAKNKKKIIIRSKNDDIMKYEFMYYCLGIPEYPDTKIISNHKANNWDIQIR
jgi:hypothetical protein